MVLITGGTGFLGRALCNRMQETGVPYRRAIRDAGQYRQGDVLIDDISQRTDWKNALANIDTVIHLAAYAHDEKIESKEKRDAILQTNYLGTVSLAEQACRAGVGRFLFMSSSKVYGDINSGETGSFFESDELRPTDVYGESKMLAEKALHGISRKSGMAVIVARAPLLYGPGVKANFLKLVKFVETSFVLPFRGARNQRSLLFVGNCVDALIKAMEKKKGEYRIYNICDNECISMEELIENIRSFSGKRRLMCGAPHAFLRVISTIVKKEKAIKSLFGRLVLDSSLIREELDWHAPFSVQAGLRITIQDYLENRG